MARLVEILARELAEWPKKCSEIWQSAMDLEIYFEGCNHEYTETSEQASDHGYSGARVTRAQWQAERDRQKGGEWKRHRGGKQPVANGTEIEYKLRDGTIGNWAPERLEWDHTNHGGDIMQYRIISQPQAEEVEVKDTTIGTLSYKISVDQIAGPLAWRDTIIHCQAIIEDCEREIQRNVDLLDAEGLMMQTDSKKAMQHYAPDVDMSDWRNWEAGDVVEVILENDSGLPIGKRYTVQSIEKPNYIGGMPVSVVDEIGDDYWPGDDKYDGRLVFKFISRP